MNRIKVVFLGTPEFAVASLIAISQREDIDIPLVISQVDRKRNRGKLSPTPVKEFAISKGLEVFTPKDINSQESIDKIMEVNPDFLVVVAYGQIIGDELLKKYHHRILNVHSSLLPKYRGAAPINWAIVDGEKQSGVSVMLVEKGLDTGDVLLRETTSIGEDETAEQLHDELMELGGRAIVEVLVNFDYYYEKRMPQNEKDASYKGILKREMGKINWNETSLEIYNKFRGFYPWPGSFFEYFDKKVKVLKMSYVLENHDLIPGHVEEVGPEYIKVASNDGFILLEEIQFPNKKKMSVSSFLRGNSFEKNIDLV
ncbi:methionyl-tRNA formyltransferase [Lagierella sp.]|uniref:methionyl-tRNA formyltransferase n=1 Tax=Lagierella sp. TaxID=2849657 RepID=UPI00260427D1|nr:methionyl-tRNA formyltransferase [Lagierella sp.]